MGCRWRWLVGLGAMVVAVGACGESDGGAVPGDVADVAGDVEPGEDTAGPGDVADEDTTPAIECPPPTGDRPAARSEHAGIYDPIGHRAVYFGGSFGVPVNCSMIVNHTFERETWIYDIACDRWRAVDAGEAGPAGRVRHAAVYDATEHRMLIWGGRSREASSGPYDLHSEMWAFDLTTETWSQVVTGPGPAPRFNHAMVYDPGAHRVLVMGGNTSANALVYAERNDVWSLDLASGTWIELQPQGFRPPARFWHSGAWDAARGWFVIFAGADNGSAFDPHAEYFNDVWALDLGASPPVWYQLDGASPKPVGRFWGGLVVDGARDRYLAFGGHDDTALGNRNDMWAFDPAAGSWELLRQGDVYNRPPTGFCMFPPDFTIVDREVPERRHAGVLIGGPDGAWLMGGKSDCGSVDDLFAYDFATDTWEELVNATVGEVCIRKGGIDCNDMCF